LGPALLTAQKQRKYSSVDYEDVHITVYGSTAIATGVYRGKGTGGGKAFDEVERWTDTWVKMPTDRSRPKAVRLIAVAAPAIYVLEEPRVSGQTEGEICVVAGG